MSAWVYQFLLFLAIAAFLTEQFLASIENKDSGDTAMARFVLLCVALGFIFFAMVSHGFYHKNKAGPAQQPLGVGWNGYGLNGGKVNLMSGLGTKI